MKKIILYMIMAIAGMIAVSCDKVIDEFDNSTNYIYFDMPFILDQYGRKTTVREDSLIYSFAMDDPSVTEYTFKVPVNSVGLMTDQDRSFKVVVESGTATKNDWDETVLSKGKISAGELIDTLRVTVKRTDVLKKEWRTITFRLEQNEHFALGATELLKAKISFTDILQPPTWWTKWERYFGEFSREKYAKWQEIYYLGADPNLEKYGPDTGKQLYWGQMPYYVNSDWTPSTFMFIRKLKQYFIDNEVYPDGDTSKPRITLP